MANDRSGLDRAPDIQRIREGDKLAIADGINLVWALLVDLRRTMLAWLPQAPATPAFAAGNFTGNGAMTVTVAAGDVSTFAYRVRDGVYELWLKLDTITVGGTPNSQIIIALPGAWVATADVQVPILVFNNTTTAFEVGIASVTAGSLTLTVFRAGLANWSASADNTYIRGYVRFPVSPKK